MSWAMIVFLVMTLVLVLVPLLSQLSARRMLGKKLALESGATESRIFYFYSPKCAPCRRMTPLIDKLTRDNTAIIKVDVAREPALASRFGIRATPTTVLVKHGTIEAVMLGAKSERQLTQMLDRMN